MCAVREMYDDPKQFSARTNQDFHDQILEKRTFFFLISTCCGIELVVFIFVNHIYQLLVLIFMYLYPEQIYALGVVCAVSFTLSKHVFKNNPWILISTVRINEIFLRSKIYLNI